MIKDSNYIVIQGWMINKFSLKPNELLVYALIYGFSQDGESTFQGSLSYLCNITSTTKPTVISIIKKLVDEDLIIKISEVRNNITFNSYKVNLNTIENFIGSKNSLIPHENNLNGGSKNSLPNNTNNNKLDINTRTVSKKFIPPSEQDVINFFKEKGYSEESAKRAFEYYETGNWKDGKGDQVKNWKQKMLSVWFKPENKIQQQQRQKLIF